MDAASNRGVDEMTQLLEQAVYAPSNARFKVYMIDEVHMLTNQAFNSMLKTLEEPPEHVKFILATTDPQKIPVTVLSRCLQFNLKQMPPGHIVSHLENILGQEQITFEVPALRLLAQGAQGSMRDGLSLTDQAIAYAAGKVTLEAVQGMLGTLDQAYLISLLDALAAQDGARLLAVADDMAARSLSYSAALQDLATLFNRIAIAQSVPQAIPEDLPEREEILRLSAQFSPEDVQLFYQIAAHGRHELGLAPDEYAGFSMTLLRMLAFTPLWSDGKSAPQPATPSSTVTSVKKVQAAASVVSASTNKTSSTASSTASGTSPSAVTEKPVSPAMAALAAARSPKANANVSASARTAPVASEKPQAAAENTTSSTDTAQKKTENSAPAEILFSAAPAKINTTNLFSNWDGSWPTLVRALSVRGVAQQLASQSELLACEPEGNVVMMRLRVPVETLLSAGSADKLSAALTEYLGKTIKLVTEIGTVAHTAHAQVVAEQATRQQEAEDAMHNDPFVQTLIKEFGGTIVPGSIKPA
jgi:DNA polymerase-3 subunit gamma/tau